MNISQDSTRVTSVLVFGAKDHIGSRVVQSIHQRAPWVKLRVATHSDRNLPTLRAMFPFAEAVVADFYDLASMEAAVDGMEGIFQISPDVFDEDRLVHNMTLACHRAGSVRHIIRILGTPPGASIDMVSESLQPFRHYPAMQHLVATDLYRQAQLPVTFLNVAGYYMDDFSRMFAQPILQERTIRVAFDKRLAWIDPQDVADVAAELLLTEPPEYTGRLIDLTGSDLCKISAVADLFTEILGVRVHYDGNEDNFYRAIKPVFTQLWGDRAPDYFVEYFRWETQHDHLFKLTPHVQNLLGRPPRTFRQWIRENREFFLSAWEAQHQAQPA